MIKETTRRIHFSPYNVAKAKPVSPEPTASLSMKYFKLVFGPAALRETGMTNQFVRFYYEPHKKIIGWQIKERVEQHEMKTWKLVKPYTTGVWTVTLKGMLSEMKGLKPDHSYNDLPVRKYREQSVSSEHNGEIFYYVQIKEKDEPEETEE